MKKSAKIALVLGVAALGALLMTGIQSPALAAGPIGNGMHFGASANMKMGANGVIGSVTAVSGNMITVQSKWPAPHAASQTPTTYTVDASNATVTKNGASSTVSAISTGDMVIARGTVSGTNVAATAIIDGMMPNSRPGMRGPGAFHPWSASSSNEGSSTMRRAPIIQGNGQPVVGGTVTAVSGTTMTITNKSNVTYTVDASSATVVKGNATSSVSNVTTGDQLVIQGTVNGASITASSIIDEGAAAQPGSGDGNGTKTPPGLVSKIFGGIGGFFRHLFGFF